jgi:catechol 2,3-dioxygenase-like lactoylglutathione lyase family enzyme
LHEGIVDTYVSDGGRNGTQHSTRQQSLHAMLVMELTFQCAVQLSRISVRACQCGADELPPKTPVFIAGTTPELEPELESGMNSVQIEQKSYEMPPREGISIAYFITVADIDRSARYYEKVFGARILSRGDSTGAPGYLQLANTWLIINVGGGPTPDKPSVTLSVPDPNHINSFMNIRVADIQACYELWKSRGAEFITEPIPKYGETRCYIRDPDGYIIEIGQSTDLTYG